MNLYDNLEIEKKIESLAIQNDGEVTEEQLQELVLAQTTSLTKIENICKYIKHLESFVDYAKEEKDRINTRQKMAEKRIESIKTYLAPYIQEKGKVTAGTFNLSTRVSESIEITDIDKLSKTYLSTVVTYKPDKDVIKKVIKCGEKVSGAELIIKNNLIIK